LERARATQCANNMRNIGLAVATYAGLNRGWLPSSSCPTKPGDVEHWWLMTLQEYGSSDLLYCCPSDESDSFVDWDNPPTEKLDRYRWASYSTNGRMDKKPFNNIEAIKNPAETIYLCETPEGIVGADHVHPEMWVVEAEVRTQVAWDRHGGHPNFLFADWHVESMTLEETWAKDKVNLWNPRKAPAWSTIRDY